MCKQSITDTHVWFLQLRADRRCQSYVKFNIHSGNEQLKSPQKLHQMPLLSYYPELSGREQFSWHTDFPMLFHLSLKTPWPGKWTPPCCMYGLFHPCSRVMWFHNKDWKSENSNLIILLWELSSMAECQWLGRTNVGYWPEKCSHSA